MEEIKLPQLGQSVEEASITTWLKQEGEEVAKGDILYTVQTDKAEIEVESTASGILRKILVPSDVEIPVMSVVALVGTADESLPDLSQYQVVAPAQAAEAPSAAVEAPDIPTQIVTPDAVPQTESPVSATSFQPVSPRALREAESLGVDVSQVVGTGVNGRVLSEDVRAQAESMKSGQRATPTARRLAEHTGVDIAEIQGSGPRGKIMKEDVQRTASAVQKAPEPAVSIPVPAEGDGQRIPLTPMRRIIAQRMTESMFTAPHYFMTVEIDMSAAVAIRDNADGFRPSYNDMVLYVAARTLRKNPIVNSRWAGDAIDEMNDVNLGVAVALPGGLVVPVIRKAQDMSLEGIHQECRILVEKARSGKLLPADYQGSTFTVSNLGTYGIDHFTAIINTPNSAILAVGRIKDAVVAIDGGIHIRPMMNVTLSSDHRVIDGAVAAQFLKTFRRIMERGEFQ